MKENTYVENMRAPALPNAFSFKEGGILAAHPLSYHPQGVFG